MEDMYRSQFRLPSALYEKLKEAATASGRSINAEIVHRLSQSFNGNAQERTGLKSVAESTLLQELIRLFGGDMELAIRQRSDKP